MLAAAAGRGGAKWVAYLSTQGPGAVNARDRIGNGPWYNARGQMIAMNNAILHGDSIDDARKGNALGKQFALTEKQGLVNGVGDMPNQHDILTGLYRRHGSHLQQLLEQRRGNGYGAARTLGQTGRRQQLVELRAREPRLQPDEPDPDGWQRLSVLLLTGQLTFGSLGTLRSFRPVPLGPAFLLSA
jgi:hypothetical protein